MRADVPYSIASPVQRVRGTTDVLPVQQRRLRALAEALHERFESFGYEGVDTPILEPLELFLRKSGDEIVARMYAFAHWNRRLCLRPEHTASVMRLFVNEFQGRSLPLRLQYTGPEFRYERPSRGRQRQYTVLGLELIGASGPVADAEVLHLALSGLWAVGLQRYRLVVGHLGVVLQMLRQLGISEHAQGLILDQMEPLARGRLTVDEATTRILGLLGAGADEAAVPSDGAPAFEGLAGLPPDQATALAADLMRRVSLPLEGSARTPHQIIQRLLAKATRADPTERVRRAVAFVARLHEASGEPDRLGALRALVEQNGLSTAPLDEVEAALRFLRAHGSVPNRDDGATWEVDLALARGLRYYTGIVFEVYVDDEGGPLQVCGGGRYDDLIRALGGREAVPASGFAYGLERLALATERGGPTPAASPKVLVVPVAHDDLAVALHVAATLRAAGGMRVEQDVRLRGVKNALRHADRSGIAATVLIGAEERAKGQAIVRGMASREERRVPVEDVVAAVQALAG